VVVLSADSSYHVSQDSGMIFLENHLVIFIKNFEICFDKFIQFLGVFSKETIRNFEKKDAKKCLYWCIIFKDANTKRRK
jgi:hypothetical protein